MGLKNAHAGSERALHTSLSGPVGTVVWGWRDSFQGHIITSDKTWCHHCKPDSNCNPWCEDVNSALKKKIKMQPSVGTVMCAVIWIGKRWSFWISSQTSHQLSATSQCWLSWQRVGTEMKTFLMQNDNSWPHKSSKTMEHIAISTLVWIWCLPTSIYLDGLVKDGLHGQS